MNKTILIVDDDRIVLMVLRDSLTLCGDYRIITAPDAKEGLRLLADHQVDLVITDLSLPGLSGVQFTEELRRDYPEVPVVWITAYGCQTVGRQSEELAVCCCIDKPIEIAELRETVSQVLRNGNGAG